MTPRRNWWFDLTGKEIFVYVKQATKTARPCRLKTDKGTVEEYPRVIAVEPVSLPVRFNDGDGILVSIV